MRAVDGVLHAAKAVLLTIDAGSASELAISLVPCLFDMWRVCAHTLRVDEAHHVRAHARSVSHAALELLQHVPSLPPLYMSEARALLWQHLRSDGAELPLPLQELCAQADADDVSPDTLTSVAAALTSARVPEILRTLFHSDAAKRASMGRLLMAAGLHAYFATLPVTILDAVGDDLLLWCGAGSVADAAQVNAVDTVWDAYSSLVCRLRQDEVERLLHTAAALPQFSWTAQWMHVAPDGHELTDTSSTVPDRAPSSAAVSEWCAAALEILKRACAFSSSSPEPSSSAGSDTAFLLHASMSGMLASASSVHAQFGGQPDRWWRRVLPADCVQQLLRALFDLLQSTSAALLQAVGSAVEGSMCGAHGALLCAAVVLLHALLCHVPSARAALSASSEWCLLLPRLVAALTSLGTEYAGIIASHLAPQILQAARLLLIRAFGVAAFDAAAAGGIPEDAPSEASVDTVLAAHPHEIQGDAALHAGTRARSSEVPDWCFLPRLPSIDLSGLHGCSIICVPIAEAAAFQGLRHADVATYFNTSLLCPGQLVHIPSASLWQNVRAIDAAPSLPALLQAIATDAHTQADALVAKDAWHTWLQHAFAVLEEAMPLDSASSECMLRACGHALHADTVLRGQAAELLSSHSAVSAISHRLRDDAWSSAVFSVWIAVMPELQPEPARWVFAACRHLLSRLTRFYHTSLTASGVLSNADVAIPSDERVAHRPLHEVPSSAFETVAAAVEVAAAFKTSCLAGSDPALVADLCALLHDAAPWLVASCAVEPVCNVRLLRGVAALMAAAQVGAHSAQVDDDADAADAPQGVLASGLLTRASITPETKYTCANLLEAMAYVARAAADQLLSATPAAPGVCF
ncbi:MAG: hypothetical protein EOO41_01295, partial [Methanobacteriota archaeon]